MYFLLLFRFRITVGLTKGFVLIFLLKENGIFISNSHAQIRTHTLTHKYIYNMLSKAVNLLLIVLLSSSLTNGVRRKSKIDVPIANAADAPPPSSSSDNVAQAAAAAAAAVASNDAQQSPNKFEDQPSAQALAATEKPTASPIALAQNAISNSLPSSAGADSSSLSDGTVSSSENEAIECDPDMIGFEIITGYVLGLAFNQFGCIYISNF